MAGCLAANLADLRGADLAQSARLSGYGIANRFHLDPVPGRQGRVRRRHHARVAGVLFCARLRRRLAATDRKFAPACSRSPFNTPHNLHPQRITGRNFLYDDVA